MAGTALSMTRAPDHRFRTTANLRVRAPFLGLWAASMLLGGCAAGPETAAEPRPSHWATPVTASGPANLYRVNASLYRSAQPTEEDLREIGEHTPLVSGDAPIATVVSLRTFRSDASLAAGAPTLRLERIPAQSWHPEHEDVVRFLRIATDPASQPVLVHCRRGADRTGTMVAVYRVVVEGWTKAAAIEEMTRGGYGFHPIWQNLVRYIEDLDVDAIRAQVAAAR
jgi:protein tyrosine/serine phosphatase